MTAEPMPSIRKEFGRDYIPEPNSGCWLYLGYINPSGYAVTTVAGKPIGVHRAYYERERGPISPGLVIDHLCRNRACVNPEHMEAVTYRENAMRGNTVPAINARKTVCRLGHPFTAENTIRLKNDGRRCRVCTLAKARAWAAKASARKTAERSTAPRRVNLARTGAQLAPAQMAALDEIARRAGLASRSAALRMVLTLGIEEWERRNGALPADQQQAAAQRQ